MLSLDLFMPDTDSHNSVFYHKMFSHISSAYYTDIHFSHRRLYEIKYRLLIIPNGTNLCNIEFETNMFLCVSLIKVTLNMSMALFEL